MDISYGVPYGWLSAIHTELSLCGSVTDTRGIKILLQSVIPIEKLYKFVPEHSWRLSGVFSGMIREAKISDRFPIKELFI